MRRPPHYLSEIDKEARQGTCSQCGPNSPLKERSVRSVGWQCMVSYRIASRHSRGRELLGEKFEKVLKKQNGKCAICKKKMNPPHADHDHKTDKFRALLCRRCNLGIAYFNDNPRLARAAAKYLELHAD